MSRRISLALLAVVALLALASFAVWRWAEGLVAQGVADWQRQIAAQGWTLTSGGSSRGGWPLAVEFSLDDVRLTGTDAAVPGGAVYTAARVTLRMDPRDLAVMVVRGEGRQSLRLGAAPPLPFTADRLRLTIPLAQAGGATSAALNGSGIAFAAPAAGLTIGLLEGSADWSAPHGIALRLSAEAITLPPPPAPQAALGPHIASATIEGTLDGMLPADATSPLAAATGWRDSGGAVTLRRIAVGWGPLGVTGSAAFKLDAALQPDLSATLRLVGMEETLTALAAANAIKPRAAQAAKAVVGLMAHAPEGGGTPGVEVPLALRDGTLSLGLIPLATVGKLDWPSGR
jgi:hypothetical protein